MSSDNTGLQQVYAEASIITSHEGGGEVSMIVNTYIGLFDRLGHRRGGGSNRTLCELHKGNAHKLG